MKRLAVWFFRWRYLVLTSTLVVFLVIQPIVLDFGDSPLVFDALLGLVLVTVLLTFTREKKWRVVAWTIGLSAAAFSLGGYAFASAAQDASLIIGHAIGIAFFLAATIRIVLSLVTAPQLSIDSVFGAICGYLLLGTSFGLAFSMIDYLSPNSFEFGSRLADDLLVGRLRSQLFVYFSFVTLTTAGYGDIMPVSPPARTLAWVEAMIGQFYLAVLVAGLVGALLRSKQPAHSSSKLPSDD
jgi:hypothetical protein